MRIYARITPREYASDVERALQSDASGANPANLPVLEPEEALSNLAATVAQLDISLSATASASKKTRAAPQKAAKEAAGPSTAPAPSAPPTKHYTVELARGGCTVVGSHDDRRIGEVVAVANAAWPGYDDGGFSDCRIVAFVPSISMYLVEEVQTPGEYYAFSASALHGCKHKAAKRRRSTK